VSNRIIIAGGGTGGHIFPAIAIANALKAQDPTVDLLFIGDKKRMEMEKVPQAGYRIEGLDIAGFDRSSLIKNIGLPFLLLKSFWQVRRILKRVRPDAVIGVGGYSSFPVLRMAQAMGIPTYIHESNSFAGRSNILLGKKARQVFTGTSGMERFFPPSKILVTGNPVRGSIAGSLPDRAAAIRSFGLDPERNVLLVMGGSLGARSINEAIDAGLDRILESGLQLVWQTGTTYSARAAARCASRPGVWTDAFITRVENAYAASDLVVARAGAMTVAELCVVGRPTVFVPYPHAAEDHQTENAKRLADRGAALIVKDADAVAGLVDTVLQLAGDRVRKDTMRLLMSDLAITDADTTIARSVLSSIKSR
jgi:UDP-N-acetylglucosamine--N-acetylmuramyl-(pentapeptide) pyrophosphoryl-undecaprenol N-acetylglucosamine transferase